MKCQNCQKHKGTENWVGSGGVLDWAHGMYSIWCKCCCLKAQIKDAERVVKSLPKLKAKLEKVNCK